MLIEITTVLTSITWSYCGLMCLPIEVEYFLKLSADKLPVSHDRSLKFIFCNDSVSFFMVTVFKNRNHLSLFPVVRKCASKDRTIDDVAGVLKNIARIKRFIRLKILITETI